jgi:hypothetical protein
MHRTRPSTRKEQASRRATGTCNTTIPETTTKQTRLFPSRDARCWVTIDLLHYFKEREREREIVTERLTDLLFFIISSIAVFLFVRTLLTPTSLKFIYMFRTVAPKFLKQTLFLLHADFANHTLNFHQRSARQLTLV